MNALFYKLNGIFTIKEQLKLSHKLNVKGIKKSYFYEKNNSGLHSRKIFSISKKSCGRKVLKI